MSAADSAADKLTSAEKEALTRLVSAQAAVEEAARSDFVPEHLWDEVFAAALAYRAATLADEAAEKRAEYERRKIQAGGCADA